MRIVDRVAEGIEKSSIAGNIDQAEMGYGGRVEEGRGWKVGEVEGSTPRFPVSIVMLPCQIVDVSWVDGAVGPDGSRSQRDGRKTEKVLTIAGNLDVGQFSKRGMGSRTLNLKSIFEDDKIGSIQIRNRPFKADRQGSRLRWALAWLGIGGRRREVSQA